MPTMRRSLVLLLAYLASAVASTLVLSVLFIVSQKGQDWSELEFFIPVILVLGVPVAWIPLAAVQALSLRLWRSRLLASLCSSAFTAATLVVWDLSLVDRFFSIDASPKDPPLWQAIVQALPFAIGVGLVGGLVFWAIAFRGRVVR